MLVMTARERANERTNVQIQSSSLGWGEIKSAIHRIGRVYLFEPPVTAGIVKWFEILSLHGTGTGQHIYYFFFQLGAPPHSQLSSRFRKRKHN